MKKQLVTLLASLYLAVSYGQTNIYHPFPEDSATWVVDNSSNQCMGYCNSHIFTMKGDTIINGTGYNKIYLRVCKFYYVSIPPNPVLGVTCFPNESYWAGIRQDSLNKKVYIIMPPMTKDTLLYDFDLNIGDTLPKTFLINGLNKQPAVVTGFDSVLIDGQYHKKFLFNNNSPAMSTINSMIEGVGSGGRLDLIYDVFEGGPVTACFNGNFIPGSGFMTECTIDPYTVSVHEQYPGNTLAISPNPFSSQAIVQTEHFLQNASLCLYNSYGQAVKQIDNLSGQTIFLERGSLPNGLYCIQLKEENKILAADKLVITDK